MEFISNHFAQQETCEVQLQYHCSELLKENWYKLHHCLQPQASLHLSLSPSLCLLHSHTHRFDFYSQQPEFPADVMIRLQMINNCFII